MCLYEHLIVKKHVIPMNGNDDLLIKSDFFFCNKNFSYKSYIIIYLFKSVKISLKLLIFVIIVVKKKTLK